MDPLESLRELFSQDDGSLPEIRVEGLGRAAVNRAVALVQGYAVAPLKYGHPDGASGPPGTDHFVARLRVEGSDLPELGVGAFDDALILDYRMGPAWTADAIRTFLALLHRIAGLEPGAYVEIEPEASPELRRAFQKAWLIYLTDKGAA
jgi:hypothetical protein